MEGSFGSLNTSEFVTELEALTDEQIELLEVEFPPLLETKTQFDDFSNVEVLDANRDFSVQLALEPDIRKQAADGQSSSRPRAKAAQLQGRGLSVRSQALASSLG